jgi:hypothetical protein
MELNELVKVHIVASRDAEKILREGQANMSQFDPNAYGAVIEMPTAEEAQSGKPVTMKIVQLGSPVCEGQTKPSETGCGAAKVTGYRYRTDELGPWQIKKVVGPGDGSTFDPDGLVRLDRGSKVLQQLARGGKATVAEASYTDRIDRIYARVVKLIENQGKLEKRLNSHANKGRQFTFFL